MIKSFFLVSFFAFSSIFLFSQEKEIKSILSIKSKLDFNSSLFNKKLQKELTSSILSIYNYKDIENGFFTIRLSYFNKPISKYAIENFREFELYKNALPKPIDFINFQRNMNNCFR